MLLVMRAFGFRTTGASEREPLDFSGQERGAGCAGWFLPADRIVCCETMTSRKVLVPVSSRDSQIPRFKYASCVLKCVQPEMP